MEEVSSSKMLNVLPTGDIASIVVTFGIALTFIILFATYYVKKYSHHSDSDKTTTLTSILALIVALLTCSLLPIDIFIVSSMKYSNGTFKEWAENITERNYFESQLLYTYYSLYSVIFIFIFLIIPFMYFFFEEKNDMFSSNRFLSAFKYTCIFLFLAVFLLLLGAFVPLRTADVPNDNNSTKNESWIDKFEDLIGILDRNRGEDAMSMVLSILTVIGVTNLAIYTAFGMFSWPISFIKGTKSANEHRQDIEDRHLNNTFNINSLLEKQRTVGLSNREVQRLHKLQEEERKNEMEEKFINSYRDSMFYKLRYMLRPVQIVFGVFILVISILIWASLLITNTDKAFHSLGMKMGYALPNSTFPNPIDFVLVKLQTVYPMDYILIILFSFVLVMYTISGYVHLGIRFFFFKLYKIVPSRTPPQAMLFLFALLMTTILGINVLFYSTFPQYVTYGNQFFIDKGTNGTELLKRCTISDASEMCTMTRMSQLLVRFFYKAWFFGAYYYWAMWAFVGFSFLSFVFVILKPRQSVTAGLLDDDEIEEDED